MSDIEPDATLARDVLNALSANIAILFSRLAVLGAILLAACTARSPALLTPATGDMVAAHAEVLPLSSGDGVRGRNAFIDLQCHACHRVAEDDSLPAIVGAWEGPLLQDLGREPAEAVAWRIVTRTKRGPESVFESPMAESVTAMTERQLVDLIAYLRDPAAAGKSQK